MADVHSRFSQTPGANGAKQSRRIEETSPRRSGREGCWTDRQVYWTLPSAAATPMARGGKKAAAAATTAALVKDPARYKVDPRRSELPSHGRGEGNIPDQC